MTKLHLGGRKVSDFGKRRKVVSPFGYVVDEPRCPYCDCVISFWTVHAMQHTKNCIQNPERQKEIKQFVEKHLQEPTNDLP